MYTCGKLVRTHPNGRINYEGQETRADGAALGADAALQAANMLDKAALEQEV